MTKKSKVPQIRFKGFSGKWEEKALEEIVDRYDNLRIPISASNRIAGDTPYYGANGIQDYVQGFTHDGEFILVAEDGANDLKNYPVQYVNGKIWVNNHAHVLQAKKDISSTKFLKYSISKINIEPFLVGGGRAKLNANIMMKINIYVPLELQEQQKIGSYFQKLDKLIQQKDKKYQKLKQFKKAMLDKMFPKNGADTPKIRFKGFSEKWKEKSLDELCLIITKQTGFDYSATIKPSLVNYESKDTYSFIQNKDFDGTNINLQTDFYIPKNIAENFPRILIDQPSILITISGKIGNVGLYSLSNKAFIGGAVGICKLINYADGLTILYSLLSQKGQSYFKSLVKASSHSNITVEDIRKIKVQIPIENEEKEKIGSYFQKLDKQIDLQQKELEKLKNIKKASLSKMFV